MNPKTPSVRGLEDRAFLWLIVGASILFALIVVPLYGAVLWAVVIAILFQPLHRKMVRSLPAKPNLAALLTLLAILVIVIIPLIVLITSLVAEATAVYDRLQSGDLNFGQYVQSIFNSMPGWASDLLDRAGLSNLRAVRDKLTAGISEGAKLVATQALSVGQNAFNFVLNLFVMLYLLFFLLRDGEKIYNNIRDALPLRPEHQQSLFNKFTVVIRATVKGIARGYEVVGWVKNLPDGRVELQASGDTEEVEAFLEAIVESELKSHIRKVDTHAIPPLTGARGFEITR